MKIEMYVLCLLRFQDDKIVFTSQELDSIKEAIADGLEEQKVFTGDRKPSDEFEVYHLDPKKVRGLLSADI